MTTDAQRRAAARFQERTLAAMDSRLPHLPRDLQDALLDATASLRAAVNDGRPDREEQPCRN